MTLPFLEGRILYDTADQMGKAMGDQIFAQQRKNNAFKQYVEAWIHEVKLPIASMRLLLHKDKGENSRVMKEQVARMDSYVEQVLYYLRSQVPEKDYVIREYSLKNRDRSGDFQKPGQSDPESYPDPSGDGGYSRPDR